MTTLVADAMMMKIARISQPPRSILTYRRGSGRLHCNRPFNVGTHAGGVWNFLHPEWSTLKGAFGASTFNAKQNVCKVNFVQACPYWGSAQGALSGRSWHHPNKDVGYWIWTRDWNSPICRRGQGPGVLGRSRACEDRRNRAERSIVWERRSCGDAGVLPPCLPPPAPACPAPRLSIRAH